MALKEWEKWLVTSAYSKEYFLLHSNELQLGFPSDVYSKLNSILDIMLELPAEPLFFRKLIFC